MATPQQAPKPSLQPEHWIAAGFVRLAGEGIESVRVEVLARDLGVQQGSFYWHFRDREDLLEKMLARWEADEVAWLASATSVATAPRRAGQDLSNAPLPRIESARKHLSARGRAGIRRSRPVSSRLRKTAPATSPLCFARSASRPAPPTNGPRVALLVYLGWLDRVTRDPEFELAGATLGEFLSNLILAAPPARTANSPADRILSVFLQ